MGRILTRAILIVSFVSLLTDVASEMLYPVMPVYLRSIGFSVFIIGLLEGIAEATAGISKGYFGNLSDNQGRRVVFIRTGYTISAFSKPMMVMLSFPLWIFICRTLDRLGKGIRTSARDALLSDESTRENKGKVFGFHRGMDTAGAAVGPMLALVFLFFYPGNYRILFYIAFIPGLLAILLTFLLKEKRKHSTDESRKEKMNPGFFTYISYWKKADREYRMLVAGLLVFSFFNSSDMFLLLKVKSSGISDTAMIGFYIFYNLVYALFSYPMGVLGDRLGMKKVLTCGLGLFAAVYFGFGFAESFSIFAGLFLFYGIYAASTEGISKALITNISVSTDTATAIGFYNSFASIATLLASITAGFIWTEFGSRVTFIFSGCGTALIIIYFIIAFSAGKK